MGQAADRLVGDLCVLLRDLGRGWGCLTPSVYDTVQVLRYLPPKDPRPILRWICSQQQDDGGWGNPIFPHSRDVPTLAALLALQMYAHEGLDQEVLLEGLAFLHYHAPLWEQPLTDDIPVAVELILPTLLKECAVLGLDVPRRPYMALRMLGETRLNILARVPIEAAGAPSHTWEMLGKDATPAMLDGSGGVGHSPAATAYWLKRAAQSEIDQHTYQRAMDYMSQAYESTGLGIPGVVPTVGPIYRFEQAWVLYALMLSNALEYAPLREPLRAQLDSLAAALRPHGASMSDHFICDGDSTATALATLASAGYPVDIALLRRYQRGDQFITYDHELQPSITATAHATHALALVGEDVWPQVKFLLSKQLPSGRWVCDKWHNSWIYATTQTMIAIAHGGYGELLHSAVDCLLAEQHADGGWGHGRHSTPAETAFVVQTLYTLWSLDAFAETIISAGALKRAYRYLLSRYDQPLSKHGTYWIGKELYSPLRVDQGFELGALLLLSRHHELFASDEMVGNTSLP